MFIYIIATLIAYFIKGLCGFGNTPVFNSISAFSYDNKDISPIELIIGLPANIVISIRGRKIINYKLCFKLIGYILIGEILGTYMLNVINPRIIKIICGIVIILVVVKMIIKENNNLFDNKLFVVLNSLFSGLICGLYGIGVFMVPFVRAKSLNNEEFKSNMGFISMFDNVSRVILYMYSGILTFGILNKAILLIPFFLSSLFLGFYVSKYINENMAKKLVYILLVITGITLIISNI